MVSLLRDDIPWLYKLGMEVYRASRSSRKSAAKEALTRFRHAIKFTMHGPFMDEFMMRSKEGHMMIRELEHMMEMILERCVRIDEDMKDENA